MVDVEALTKDQCDKAQIVAEKTFGLCDRAALIDPMSIDEASNDRFGTKALFQDAVEIADPAEIMCVVT
jgi:hypothetical protein